MLRAHRLHGCEVALALGHLDGIDTLTAAVLLRVIRDRRAFAVTALGNDKQVAVTVGNLHTKNAHAFLHANAADAAGIATGGAHLVLGEHNRLARGGCHDNLVTLAHATYSEQRVVVPQVDGD